MPQAVVKTYLNANGQTVALDPNGSWKIYNPGTGRFGAFAKGPDTMIHGAAHAGTNPQVAPAAPAAAVPPAPPPPVPPAAAASAPPPPPQPAVPPAPPATGATMKWIPAWFGRHRLATGLSIATSLATLLFFAYTGFNHLFAESPATELTSVKTELSKTQSDKNALAKERDGFKETVSSLTNKLNTATATANSAKEEAAKAKADLAEAQKAKTDQQTLVPPPPAPPSPPSQKVADVTPPPRQIADGPCAKLVGTHWSKVVNNCVPNSK